jgi:hypothetical protein
MLQEAEGLNLGDDDEAWPEEEGGKNDSLPCDCKDPFSADADLDSDDNDEDSDDDMNAVGNNDEDSNDEMDAADDTDDDLVNNNRPANPSKTRTVKKKVLKRTKTKSLCRI